MLRGLASIPPEVLDEFCTDSTRRRSQVDAYLDQLTGEKPLAESAHAAIVQGCLLFFDSQRYNLLGWCIMPNHIHVLIEQIPGYSLGSLIRSWKQFSTLSINRLTGQNGPIWAPDYFDRFMRNERHFAQTLSYIEANPVKAGLMPRPEDWPFSSAHAKPSRERALPVR